MTPTRWPSVVGLVLLAGIVGWVIPDLAYGDLVVLPRAAAVTAAVIAVFELGLAHAVRQRVRGRAHGKPMHALQIARAAVLAKASTATGALLAGFYAGFFLWVVRRTEVRAAAHDAWVAGWSVVACVGLLVAGLLLEKACRTPAPHDEMRP